MKKRTSRPHDSIGTRSTLLRRLSGAATLFALCQSAAAQLQFEALGKRGLPRIGDATTAVASGDVDGDGDLDLVFGNANQQNRLCRNDGNGRFTDATAVCLPVDSDTTTAVALGDVDGDGDLDLVFGNLNQQIRLCINDGQGTFADARGALLPALSMWTNAVALGDVDGDGDLDLVCANNGQSVLLVNDGTGAFVDMTAARMPVRLDANRAAVLGDVDGDGDLDLVFGNEGSTGSAGGQSRLYLNNGLGTFVDASARMPQMQMPTQGVALGDVDGDGDLDLVLVNNNGSSGIWTNVLYLNDGTGTFSWQPTRLPHDFDGAAAVALGDVDGDNDLDLVVANRGFVATGGAQNRLYLNNGAGVFASATAGRMPTTIDPTTCLVLGDFDGDADLDVVFGNGLLGAYYHPPEYQDRLYLNDGTGVFVDATASRIPLHRDHTAVLGLGDVDGDGNDDLVLGNGVAYPGEQMRLLLNDGMATFTDATTRLPVANLETRGVSLGDFDRDGDLDIVCGCYNQDRLYRNNAGTFTDVSAATLPPYRSDTTGVVVGDVDADGDLDLVFADRSGSRLLLNYGTGSFVGGTLPSSIPAGAVAIGDIEGDGDLDLLFGAGDGIILLNNGTGMFTPGAVLRNAIPGTATTSIALVDIDGDGDLDAVLVGSIGPFNQTSLFLNIGNNAFVAASATRMPAVNANSVAAGDVDDDGDVDLVFGSLLATRLLLNDGTGTFADASTVRMPADDAQVTCLAVRDLDRDGDPDVVLCNAFSTPVVYVNLLRQLDAPFQPCPGRPFQLDVYARYGPARLVDGAIPYLSTGTASMPLPPLGTVGIDLANLVPLPTCMIPPGGVGSVTIAVPNDPLLAGVRIYGQALLVQYPTQFRLTNVIADVIWR